MYDADGTPLLCENLYSGLKRGSWVRFHGDLKGKVSEKVVLKEGQSFLRVVCH